MSLSSDSLQSGHQALMIRVNLKKVDSVHCSIAAAAGQDRPNSEEIFDCFHADPGGSSTSLVARRSQESRLCAKAIGT